MGEEALGLRFVVSHPFALKGVSTDGAPELSPLELLCPFVTQGQQRPAALRVGRGGAAGAKDRSGLQAARGARAFGTGDVGAQGVQRIVGDEAAPDEAPEGIDGFAGIAAADGLMQRVEEAGAGGFKHGEELFFALGERFRDWPLLRQQGQFVGKKESDAAVAFADGLDAGPGHFAGGDQGIETGGIVAGDARGQDGRFKQRCGQRRALQAFDGVEQARRDAHGRCGAARAGPASG